MNDNSADGIYENDSSSHPPVDATDNWWGTTNEAEILKKIGYRPDGAELGIVNYSPYVTEPVLIV